MKSQANIKLYSQKRITEKGQKGWLFTYAEVYNENTVSTEKNWQVWIENKKEAFDNVAENFNIL